MSPSILLYLLAAMTATPSTVTKGPSFDCKLAKSAVEKLICADPELSDMDRRMGLLYAEARRERPGEVPAIDKEQIAWLKERNACDEESCLRISYSGRSGDLVGAMPVLEKATDIEAVLRLFATMTPDDLNHATTDDNRNALAAASCVYFQRSPHLAADLFRSNFGGSMDGWQPLCADIRLTRQVPAVQPFIDALNKAVARGNCYGSVQHTFWRNESLLMIQAVVDADPDMDGYRAERAKRREGLNYEPDLRHWSQQGLWEKSVYADIQRTQAAAREALLQDYATRLHQSKARAATLADFRIEQLVDIHIRDHAGFSSTLSYPSLCWDTKDLDRYVSEGKLPDKVCPYQEFADVSAPVTLQRLLDLAIVNDYPVAVVQRLIDASAGLGPQTGEYGSLETPLMLAAARTDVIQALLAAGAGTEDRNGFGKTALMYAVAENNLGGVRALLDAGAGVNATTAALDKGCTNLKAGERTALMYAAWHARPDMLKLLLDAKADRDLRDSNGETARQYIARNDKLDADQRKAMEALLAN